MTPRITPTLLPLVSVTLFLACINDDARVSETVSETGVGDGDGDGEPGDAGDGDGDAGEGDGDGESGAMCGNAVVEAGEQCDDGNPSDADACTNACIDASCGDGNVYEGVEQCDDGNSAQTDDCTNTCTAAVCGDGIVHDGIEMCDDGNADELDGCNSQCMSGSCGDGLLQAGEACDDGNADNTDACAGCQMASCGDGYVQADVEDCDDANDVTTDACIDCITASCGDGHVQENVEGCDDGNDVTADDCVLCEAATCGDGYVRAGVEQCDGNDLAEYDCTDLEFTGGTLSCAMDCSFDTSQCLADPCDGEGTFYADHCWIIADDCDAAVSCANAGHVGTHGEQAGLSWDAPALEAIAAGLGVASLGDTGCCAISAWYNGNEIYTHNFGDPYYNYACLGNDFPIHACTPD
jgi:cysteine-rich repeat protein